MINAKYVDGLELRIRELSKKLSDEADAALHLIAESKSLKAELDALAATIEALRAIHNKNYSSFEEYDDDLSAAFEAAPKQHLAEIKAQAGQKAHFNGYMLGYEHAMTSKEKCEPAVYASQYADSIRQGEVK